MSKRTIRDLPSLQKQVLFPEERKPRCWHLPAHHTQLSGHAVTFRSSATVFADILISGSTSTRILSGKPARAMWSAATFFTLYRIRDLPHCPYRLLLLPRWLDSLPARGSGLATSAR